MLFSRDPNTHRIFEIECLRGFAALYVVFFHVLRPEIQTYSYVLSIPFRFGQEAVILFFLLSGFSINYSWSKKDEKSFKIFARDRLLRIMPIFMVALVVSYFCAAFSVRALIDMDLGAFAGNAMMLQDRPRPGTIVEPYMGNKALWSLSYEVAFYLFYYVLTRFSPANRRTFIVGVASFLFFLLMLVYPNQLSRFLSYFCIWWLGAVMSEIYLGRIQTREFFLALVPVFLVALCLAVLASDAPAEIDVGSSILFPFLELRHFAGAIVIALVIFGWSVMGWKGFRRLFGPFVVLAPVSYALYVLHYPIMSVARENLNLSPWLAIPLTAMLTLVISGVLEGPFQQSVNRAIKTRQKKSNAF